MFADYHYMILKNFFNTCNESTINNIKHLWGVDKEGYCFSMNLMVKIIPSLEDYEIMGFVHKLNDSDYILTDNHGEITTIGRKVCNLLEFLPKDFKENFINIQLMAPKLIKYYEKICDNMFKP